MMRYDAATRNNQAGVGEQADPAVLETAAIVRESSNLSFGTHHMGPTGIRQG